MTIAYVYWLISSNLNNPLTEGYIGVSKNPQKRFSSHKYRNENTHLRNAFKKYGSDIELKILLKGDEKYCYEIEERLRPTTKIGWNINKGGETPPSHKGRKNAPRSEETKKKISNSKLGVSINNPTKVKKGQHLSPSTEFKKGQPASGIPFEKGNVPWNAGKSSIFYWITNGKENKVIKDLNTKLEEGWTRGRSLPKRKNG